MGSIRDDFDFGAILFLRTEAVKKCLNSNYKYAGLYDLRLNISSLYEVLRIPEYLYFSTKSDVKKSGEKQFDYVDPQNRERQLEMESAASEYLKKIGAESPLRLSSPFPARLRFRRYVNYGQVTVPYPVPEVALG